MNDLPEKLNFVDIETTGCTISDRIIEIGLLRIENGKIKETFSTLINPNCFVPDEIVQLTGISRAELDNAPTFGQIKKDLRVLLDNAFFVAHNARFDYSFIKNEFLREEITFRSKQICTVKLSRQLFPNYTRHNLDSLIERFNFKCLRRHRAFDDAKVLWDFWQVLQKTISREQLIKALNFVLKKPSSPINIDQKILDGLPESPGVYIFYGKSGVPLYIGKSINLKDRILSHFSSDHSSSTELKISQQITSIEAIQTPGELGALLKETALIKQMQPLYNRKLRYSKKMYILKKEVSKEGYFRAVLDTSDNIDIKNLENILGIFRNKRSAKNYLNSLSKEHELCNRLLGIEKTNSGCFGYTLGRCKGACKNKEIALKYNLRFTKAFANTKIRPWPFSGLILIKETGEDGQQEGFLVDKWCYLGNIKYPSLTDSLNHDLIGFQLNRIGVDRSEPPVNPATLSHAVRFDLDTYKILLSFLSNPKNLKNVKVIKSGDLKTTGSFPNQDSSLTFDSV